MIDIDSIELENNLEYDILDEIIINNIKYLYLINKDINDAQIRKLDDEENLNVVTDKAEYDKAMLEFLKKHKHDFA